jgi:hypothetical protein
MPSAIDGVLVCCGQYLRSVMAMRSARAQLQNVPAGTPSCAPERTTACAAELSGRVRRWTATERASHGLPFPARSACLSRGFEDQEDIVVHVGALRSNAVSNVRGRHPGRGAHGPSRSTPPSRGGASVTRLKHHIHRPPGCQLSLSRGLCSPCWRVCLSKLSLTLQKSVRQALLRSRHSCRAFLKFIWTMGRIV